MAQVRDHGRVVGVVTLEDLIEEYLGTFNDWTHSNNRGGNTTPPAA